MHMHSPQENQQPGQTQARGLLNVIFHGLFAYVISDTGIEILVPQLTEHTYKAGTWGQEMRLSEGRTYQLQGVTDYRVMPAGTPDPSLNAVVYDFPDIYRSGPNFYCSLQLPFPKALRSVRRSPPIADLLAGQKVFKAAFNGKDSTGINKKIQKVAMVQVLVYEYGDISALKLACRQGSVPEPSLAWDPILGDGTVNLHVFAEPEFKFDQMQNHPIHGMEALRSLFPKLDLQLNFAVEALPDRSSPVIGLSVEEEASLPEQLQLVKSPVPVPQVDQVYVCYGLFVVNPGGA